MLGWLDSSQVKHSNKTQLIFFKLDVQLWQASFKLHIWHTAFVLSSLNLKCSHTAEVFDICIFSSR